QHPSSLRFQRLKTESHVEPRRITGGVFWFFPQEQQGGLYPLPPGGCTPSPRGGCTPSPRGGCTPSHMKCPYRSALYEGTCLKTGCRLASLGGGRRGSSGPPPRRTETPLPQLRKTQEALMVSGDSYPYARPRGTRTAISSVGKQGTVLPTGLPRGGKRPPGVSWGPLTDVCGRVSRGRVLG